MHDPALILVVDDNEANVDILETRLTAQGYRVITAADGEAALQQVSAAKPDLILLDVMMPKLDGIAVTRILKADTTLPFIPIILVTAKADTKDVIAGLDAGADEYLTKPVDQAALVARVRSILRIKALHERTEEQARLLSLRSQELAGLNATLEERVRVQIDELQRLARLKRFLPRQVAEALVSADNEGVLASHRREITVVFCDLRGFTAFSEVAEPEEIMGVLAAYHDAAGHLIDKHEATLERFAGDGLMLFFNDPIPCADPIQRAARFALEMRSAMLLLGESWAARGYKLGFGIGITHGFATLGRIGFEGRGDYAAIGSVVNQAARLCQMAKAGEILISQRVRNAADADAVCEPLGDIEISGLRQPMAVFRLIGAL